MDGTKNDDRNEIFTGKSYTESVPTKKPIRRYDDRFKAIIKTSHDILPES